MLNMIALHVSHHSRKLNNEAMVLVSLFYCGDMPVLLSKSETPSSYGAIPQR